MGELYALAAEQAAYEVALEAAFEEIDRLEEQDRQELYGLAAERVAYEVALEAAFDEIDRLESQENQTLEPVRQGASEATWGGDDDVTYMRYRFEHIRSLSPGELATFIYQCEAVIVRAMEIVKNTGSIVDLVDPWAKDLIDVLDNESLSNSQELANRTQRVVESVMRRVESEKGAEGVMILGQFIEKNFT